MPTDVPGDVGGLDDTLSVPPDSRPREPESESTRRIGPYRLLHAIGEGGMGEVWVAEQLEPVRRKVALKVIKAGMDTKQVVARFEAERQALALMDHPAIAKVLDGGSTPEGRPYFVMEYVPGVSLTEHCDTHRLPTEERLKLFIEVCEGVQHAHQKAIIHRDLKPSNILVSLVDGRAQPKIIDFGIAKATGQRLTEKTLFTEVGSVIGTPEYMSPEQADLTNQDIDTRTDVYSLGVILYQLLTGELPFGSKELRASSYEEMRRKIREIDPPRPSTRITLSGEGVGELARRRQTDPTALRRHLRGDLDAITMKALEKERQRRYGSASELAADVVRFLGHEPVLARPSGRLYRVGKYVRRHRLGASLVTASLVLLIVFSIAMAVQTRRLARERDRANAERDWAMTWVQHATEIAGLRRFSDDPAYGKLLDPLLFRATDLRDAGDYVGAERLARDTLDLAKRLSPKETFFTIWSRNLLGEALMKQKRFEEAERIFRENLPFTPLIRGDALPMSNRAVFDLARVLAVQGRGEEALSVLDELFRGDVFPGIGSWLTSFPELSNVRGEPRLLALLEKSKAVAARWCQNACGSRTAEGSWEQCLLKDVTPDPSPKVRSPRAECEADCKNWCPDSTGR